MGGGVIWFGLGVACGAAPFALAFYIKKARFKHLVNQTKGNKE